MTGAEAGAAQARIDRMAILDGCTDFECRFMLTWLAAESPGTPGWRALESALGALARYRAQIAGLRAQISP